VAEEHVRAVLPHVSSVVAAMIELQLITGMRPGEVCSMRVCDIDTTNRVWVYRPPQHKTLHHGHSREVFVGPRSQQILRPFLSTDLQALVFRPSAAVAERRLRDHARRKTPLSCGNRPGLNPKRRPERVPGDMYDVDAYRRAIARGCERAFPAPAELLAPQHAGDLRAWRRAHRWHPHQLRHTAATNLRRKHGLEAAQVILGHKTLTVTQVYAERNVQAASAIAAEVG
jgi:integrase